MNTYGYGNNKERLAHRLNRIEGQVRGIQKMVMEDKYCIDILTQVSAAQAALDKVALELLRDHTRHCLAEGDKSTRLNRADELVDAVGRMLH